MSRTLDELDRVTFEDYLGTTLDITASYDDLGIPFSMGRLTRIERGGNAIGYAYDRFGRLTQDGTLGYEYDRNSNRRRIAYPGQVSATYAYDFANREVGLDLEMVGAGVTPLVMSASYEPAGPLNSLSLGNGLQIDMQYFLIACLIVVIGMLMYYDHMRSKIPPQMKEREDLSVQLIKDHFYPELHVPRNTFEALWKDVADSFLVPAGKIRPKDRFGIELPFSEFTSDEDLFLAEAIYRRMKEFGIEEPSPEFETVDDYIQFFTKPWRTGS